MITVIETLKELGEGVVTKRPEENVIDKMQPEARVLEGGMRELLFKEAH